MFIAFVLPKFWVQQNRLVLEIYLLAIFIYRRDIFLSLHLMWSAPDFCIRVSRIWSKIINRDYRMRQSVKTDTFSRWQWIFAARKTHSRNYSNCHFLATFSNITVWLYLEPMAKNKRRCLINTRLIIFSSQTQFKSSLHKFESDSKICSISEN